MKRRFIRIVSLCLAIFLILGQSMTASAAVPGLNSAVTQKNVLALADTYDKDGSYILRSSILKGRNILEWWDSGTSLWRGMDTAVHEECHAFSFLNASYNSEIIYLGNQKYINVPYTSVYPSQEMALTMPQKLRTFRWATYVGNPTPNMASDVWGAYGLLNEFTAYCWGMHMTLSLYNYLKSSRASTGEWLFFLNNCANGRLAYAEFKYYILHYMYYAKKHYPAVYKGIKKNKYFVKAYTTVEKKFAAQNAKFLKYANKLGWQISGDWCRDPVSGYGLNIFQGDYDRLTKEVSKKKYRNLL